jgi:DNA polymerase-3 subunit epsilon
MTGGQSSLLDEGGHGQGVSEQVIVRLASERPRLKIVSCEEDELLIHQQRLAKIAKVSGDCLWLRD